MALSQANLKLIRERAGEAGDHLKDRLPPIEFLKERNSYAHVWSTLKAQLGKSYKDCDDEDVPRILGMIEWCKNNPC
jgi:hypothetical protein